MKTTFTVLTVCAAVVIGALALKGPHAQAPSARTLPAFYISEFEVTDPEGMKPYSARVASTLRARPIRGPLHRPRRPDHPA